MKKNLTEFIGTFILVFTIGCAVASGSNLAPIAIAAVMSAVIYAGVHLSGAHYNPAITLAMLVLKKIDRQEAFMYMLFQIIGGILGAFASYVITDGSANAIQMAPGSANLISALFAEIIGTFIMAYVIFSNLLSENKKNTTFSLSIGLSVLAINISLGSISGGAFNPAVGFGRCMASLITGANDCFASCWLYVIGPIIGANLAAFVFGYLSTGGDGEA